MSLKIPDPRCNPTAQAQTDGDGVQNKVCDIVTEVLGLEDKVEATQSLIELGADSIDIATLVVTLQDEFTDVESIDDSMLENIQTPAEISRFILARRDA